jgi:hypothetical protein
VHGNKYYNNTSDEDSIKNMPIDSGSKQLQIDNNSSFNDDIRKTSNATNASNTDYDDMDDDERTNASNDIDELSARSRSGSRNTQTSFQNNTTKTNDPITNSNKNNIDNKTIIDDLDSKSPYSLNESLTSNPASAASRIISRNRNRNVKHQNNITPKPNYANVSPAGSRYSRTSSRSDRFQLDLIDMTIPFEDLPPQLRWKHTARRIIEQIRVSFI